MALSLDEIGSVLVVLEVPGRFCFFKTYIFTSTAGSSSVYCAFASVAIAANPTHTRARTRARFDMRDMSRKGWPASLTAAAAATVVPVIT